MPDKDLLMFLLLESLFLQGFFNIFISFRVIKLATDWWAYWCTAWRAPRRTLGTGPAQWLWHRIRSSWRGNGGLASYLYIPLSLRRLINLRAGRHNCNRLWWRGRWRRQGYRSGLINWLRRGWGRNGRLTTRMKTCGCTSRWTGTGTLGDWSIWITA